MNKPLLLGVILNWLIRLGMTDKEIINLLSPKHIKGGLKILKETE